MTPANIREIAEDPRSVAYKTVGGYIARIEHFCTGVNLGIYDKKTVYSLAHGYLDGKVIRSRIEPIIEKKHRHADKDYYENTATRSRSGTRMFSTCSNPVWTSPTAALTAP